VLALTLLSVAASIAIATAQEPHPAPSDYNPKVSKASDEGLKAIPRIVIPKGLKIDLFAAEPLLANPVAFCIDERGRFYVAETFRHSHGVTDNRSHMYWLDDDLASKTVEDRLAMTKKHAKDKFASYSVERDRVRLVEDKDGDGVAETASVFADDFGGPMDGIGSGLLAREGNVYFTCIPDLWLLRDENNDGKAEIRKSLSHGYGVHVAFIGHDLHGLRIGPDGKLYFTVGDRGLNVKQGERSLVLPDEGAVLRCNLDGSDLEIFHRGLRNPQELAFDEHGNLFTCDNNSDGGDRARWVQIIEGGDSGWRIGYQYHDRPTARGPWNAERLWDAEKQWNPQYDGYASYIVPPLANFSDGPSGLCYYPGTGLPIRYNGHFFLCDFRGSSGSSGVRSVALRPKGATFELTDAHEFVWKLLATDCDFGPDGGFYVSDWVEGWNKPGKGRIYRVTDPALAGSPVIAEVKKLLGGELAKKSPEELVKLLKHADQRVRQEAQFALAKQGKSSVPLLFAAVADRENPLARVHAVWALGQILSKSPEIEKLAPFLADPEAEVRAQTAKVLGDSGASEVVAAPLAALLKDPNPRVKLFGAMAYGKLGRSDKPITPSRPQSLVPIFDFLRTNSSDPYLRHAGVIALTWRNDPEALAAGMHDPSPAVRLGVLLAMRRLGDPRVAEFLNDTDPQLVLEAARAINDTPIPDAMPKLAALASKSGISEHVQRRALNAQFRMGEAKNAAIVAQVAARVGAPESVRLEALGMLGDWEKPSGRDRVLGLWRPLPARSADIAAAALKPVFAGTLAGSDKVRQASVQLAGKLGIKDVGPTLFAQITNPASTPAVRAESLKALEALKDPKLAEGMKLALADADPLVRTEGRRVMAQLDPAGAVEKLREAVDKGQQVERQGALATLASMKSPEADGILTGELDALLEGTLPATIHLDLIEAARTRKTAGIPEKLAKFDSARAKNDALAKYRECLEGGDAEVGKRIFLERAQVSCQRCHKITGVGGEVGPDLTDIGAKQKRDYLLEALVDPNKAIAKGFETLIVETSAGQVLTGILKEENAKEVKLITPEGRMLVIPKADIENRSQGKSAMPDTVREQLSLRDLRDLVEYLSTLKK